MSDDSLNYEDAAQELNDAQVLADNDAAIVAEETTVVRGPAISRFTMVLALVLLGVGLSTAAVAYTDPLLLEPIANILPDDIFGVKLPAGRAFTGGGC